MPEGNKDKVSEKRKQELYVELKELDEHIKSMNSHLEKIDEQITELNTSKLTVNKFSELKKGDELRVPLTSGVYVIAELKETEKVMINVGAGVTVEKKPSEVLDILDSQLLELAKYRDTLIGNMKELIKRIEVIQKEFE